jgi:hypothetical protein
MLGISAGCSSRTPRKICFSTSPMVQTYATPLKYETAGREEVQTLACGITSSWFRFLYGSCSRTEVVNIRGHILRCWCKGGGGRGGRRDAARGETPRWDAPNLAVAKEFPHRDPKRPNVRHFFKDARGKHLPSMRGRVRTTGTTSFRGGLYPC